MKRFITRQGFLFLLLMVLSIPVNGNAAALLPEPAGIFKNGITQQSPPHKILEAFLDIPYRFDGASDENGQYTQFAERQNKFATPGLNCSGLVLAASRFLLKKNITLEQSVRDRLGDSGPDSKTGHDWDFGWDLIMNISDGYKRSFLIPGGKFQDPDSASGFNPEGYDIHTPATWDEFPQRLEKGKLYLVSLTMPGRRKGYGLQHYHVGLIHVTPDNKAWFYQTTGKGAVSNRRDLKSADGQASFKKAFANSGKKRKKMVVLAVDLPEAP